MLYTNYQSPFFSYSYWTRRHHAHVNKFRCFPATTRSAGNIMLCTGKQQNQKLIVIWCDFESSKTQVWIIKKIFKSYFLFFFDSWYITKHLLNLTSVKQYVLWSLDGHVSLGSASGNISGLGTTKHTVSLGLSQ